MCLPLAALPLALAATSAVVGIGSSVASYIGQNQAAHAAQKAANLNYANKANQVATENTRLSNQETQTNVSNAVRAAQSMGEIAASSSSLGSPTVHQLIGANLAGLNRARGVTDANAAARRVDLSTELYGAALERNSTIASNPRATLGSLALGIGSSLVNAGTTYASLGGKFPTPATGA